MKILWVINNPLPIISEDMNMSVNNGGGWYVSFSDELIKSGNTLCICFPINPQKDIVNGMIEGIRYYGIPCNQKSIKNDFKAISLFENVIKDYSPVVVHIWGTEYSHNYFAIQACKNLGFLDHTVLSIQGLVSVISEYYNADIPWPYTFSLTPKDIFRGNSIHKEQKNFRLRGILEKKSLRTAKYIIGRTDWDKACIHTFAPESIYLFCNEILRYVFYENTWNVSNCERHSIFASQCQYPIKGFHKLIQAVYLVKKRFPDVTVYVTGKNRIPKTIKESLSFSTYDFYLYRLIKQLDLIDNIKFLGNLSERDMCRQFLKANVFVSPSSIENSPNSVCEAMLLGVPTIASDVGGVKNLLTHCTDGLVYPFPDIYTLADYICEIFSNDELAVFYSKNAQKHAAETNSREKNVKRLLEIYEQVRG